MCLSAGNQLSYVGVIFVLCLCYICVIFVLFALC